MKTCLFLLASGLLDATLTNFGIVHGIIEEGNPIAQFLIEKSWYLFYLIKILLPIILIVIMLLNPLKGWIWKLIRVSGVVYLSLLVYHLAWIVIYVKSIS